MDPTTFDQFIWELAFESTRIAARPELPSRLSCVFACENVEDAKAFRDLCRHDAHIYAVELASSDLVTHRGDYELITHTARSGSYIDYMPTEALRYWTEPPLGMVEVIVGGPVRVIEPIVELST